MPFLARFINDWATEDLVKQFIKDRRGNHYRKGWLDVPEKYSHLKENAQKRDKSVSRTKKASLAPAGSASARNATGSSKPSQGRGSCARMPRVRHTDEEEDKDKGTGKGAGKGTNGEEEEEEEEE